MLSLVGYPITELRPIMQLSPISDFPSIELNPSNMIRLPSTALLERKLPDLSIVITCCLLLYCTLTSASHSEHAFFLTGCFRIKVVAIESFMSRQDPSGNFADV